jgi:hypothetical protein
MLTKHLFESEVVLGIQVAHGEHTKHCLWQAQAMESRHEEKAGVLECPSSDSGLIIGLQPYFLNPARKGAAPEAGVVPGTWPLRYEAHPASHRRTILGVIIFE